jgi:hypothetical protein
MGENIKSVKNSPMTRGFYVKRGLKELGSDLSQSKAALATIGAGGLGLGAAVGIPLSKRKKALSKVAEEAFLDELDTIAMEKEAGLGTTLDKSFKNLGKTFKHMGENIKSVKNSPMTRGFYAKRGLKELGSDLSQSKAALATIGAGGLGTGLTVGAIAKRKKKH